MSRVLLLLDAVPAHARAIVVTMIVARGSGCALWHGARQVRRRPYGKAHRCAGSLGVRCTLMDATMWRAQAR
jgi:hypothetical protein